MCLILVAHQFRADLPLLLLANRDEFLDRATAPLGPWPGSPAVVAGRDLLAGGSWLGAGADGRWAAVTNVRDGERAAPGQPSRGWLVRDYLLGGELPETFSRRLAVRAGEYAGFNLLLGGGGAVWYVGNRGAPPCQLPPGVYGLSNGRLDSPWPKVERGKAALAGLAGEKSPAVESGFRLLCERETFADHQLPQTGVPIHWERALSATFIAAPEHGYGTRSSTVLLQGAGGRTMVVERTYRRADPHRWSQRSYGLSTKGFSCPAPDIAKS